MAIVPKNVTAAWQTRSHWLARWTLARLVNRTDVWGRYLPRAKWRTSPDGQPIYTRLGPVAAKRGKLRMSEAALARHYRGEDGAHAMGIHTASENNLSKWIAIDLEGQGGEGGAQNLKAAEQWREELVSLGFRPVLIDADGQGSYQLLVVFREAMQTGRANEFARSLVRDAGEMGLGSAPRILPGGGAYDENEWLRLPGRHPITGHWSRVWNRTRWAEGADAVEALLHAHGDAPTLMRKMSVVSNLGGAGLGGGGAATAAPVTGRNRDADSAIAAIPTYSASGEMHRSNTTAGGIPIQGAAPAQSETTRQSNNDAAPAGARQNESDEQHPEHRTHHRLEGEIICYLLSATRTGQETEAFEAVRASDVSEEAFTGQEHRRVFQALDKLHSKTARITPTSIAEEIPESHRQPALALIDQLILQRPVDADRFESLLAKLSKRSSGDDSGSAQDGELATLRRKWPSLPPAIRQAIMALADAG